MSLPLPKYKYFLAWTVVASPPGQPATGDLGVLRASTIQDEFIQDETHDTIIDSSSGDVHAGIPYPPPGA